MDLKHNIPVYQPAFFQLIIFKTTCGQEIQKKYRQRGWFGKCKKFSSSRFKGYKIGSTQVIGLLRVINRKDFERSS